MATLLEKVRKAIPRILRQAPGQIRERKAELAKEQVRLDNFVKFVAAGNHSQVISESLARSETQVEQLKEEIGQLHNSSHAPKLPSREWIESRTKGLRELFEKRSSASGQALRQVLGSILMQPIHPQQGRPYYTAKASVSALASMQMLNSPQLGGRKGSTTCESWARLGSNQ